MKVERRPHLCMELLQQGTCPRAWGRFLAPLALGLVLSTLLSSGARAQQPQEERGPQAALDSMGLVGYADRLSVEPGETIRFMVSSEVPQYSAQIVRLIHATEDPEGPGMKQTRVETPVNRTYRGQRQSLPLGSYVTVPDSPILRLQGSLTIAAWLAPTRPGETGWPGRPGAQGVVTKWAGQHTGGYALVIDESGRLALWLGDANGQVAKVAAEPALRAWVPSIPGAEEDRPRPHNVPTHGWYFVAATFDAANGTVTLHQEPLRHYPNDPTRVVVEKVTPLRSLAVNTEPLLIAAHKTSNGEVEGHFNGKMESPQIYDRVLARDEIMSIAAGSAPPGVLAAWDFAADIRTDRVRDTAGRGLDGRTVNLPTRAVTGHLWDGTEMDYTRAPKHYGAIWFHDDDLLDATWDVAFAFDVPVDLPSGVYAAWLRSAISEDYVPFFVRPPAKTPTAEIALVIPTFSYLAYSDTGETVTGGRGMSLYSTHTDGSGVTYASRLRPLTSMRPNGEWGPWQFEADMHLVDWLDAKGFKVDVVTDHDLHFAGPELLEPYNVVLTGTHPEYYSREMLQGVGTYLGKGGRLMYMGGNGFYWVTAIDPSGTFIEVRRRDGTEAWQGAPGESYHTITAEPGGLWRFQGHAPQSLVGVGFTAQGFDRNSPYRRLPDSFDPRVAFIFEGIDDNELIGNHPSIGLEFGAAGEELDRVDYALGSPPHTLILARSFGHSDAYQHVVEEVNTSNSLQGGTVNPLVYADMAYLEYPNGGAVFSTGSIAWSGSLAFNDYQNNVSRLTENVLRRFASDEPLPAPSETPSTWHNLTDPWGKWPSSPPDF